jgi:aspartyl aminopeptidase
MRDAKPLALSLLGYIDRSPSAFHAVHAATRLLEAAGFTPLRERDAWSLDAGDRRYVMRNDASIIAFVLGVEPPASSGFAIVGAHTDSPHLRVKPNADVARSGYLQLAVEPYGGMLLSTWMDRDLSLAGRVLVESRGRPVETMLVDLERPLLRVPNLALHLDREVNQRGLVLNQQQHMVPVLGLEGARAPRPPSLRALLADQLTSTRGARVQPASILGWDLSLYDTHKATLGGHDEAFVFASRLDNLASCHAGLEALRSSVERHPRAAATRVLALWDNEECGSRSAHGAAGPFLRQVLERLVEARGGAGVEAAARSWAASFLVSADMAHAVHPNYADRHEPGHLPVIGKGPVIKINANQSYATDGASAARFASLCRSVGFEPQRFVMRSDLPCGSTIGPITASLTGMPAVDVGNPMLGMHSIREMAGVQDHAKMVAVMGALFGASGQVEPAARRSARARASR